MNEELIEIYLEGFKQDIWSIYTEGSIVKEGTTEWTWKLSELEDPIIDEFYLNQTLDDESQWKRKNVPEWKEAQKRWNKLRFSKLWKSLK